LLGQPVYFFMFGAVPVFSSCGVCAGLQ